LPAERVAEYESMFVWDGDGSGKIQFDAAEIASKKLGSIVENQTLRAAIYKTVSRHKNVEIFSDVDIESIEQLEQEVKLILAGSDKGKSQKLIRAKLLIGADGAFSTVREKLNISINQMPYNQIAFVANVKTENPHRNTAWQRFTSSGPIAFLPLPESDLCSIVWTIDCDKAEKLEHLSPQEFANLLASNFENKLGSLTAISDFQGFPLIKRHANTYLSQRCVLIGDAAHTIHPLAGQGVNLGFQDVACLSQTIIQLMAKQRDFGLKANLRVFERQRKAENTLMQESMTGFKLLFAQQDMTSVLIRNAAMTTLDKTPFIKQAIIQRAMS